MPSDNVLLNEALVVLFYLPVVIFLGWLILRRR